METNLFLGLVFILLAAVCNGTLAVPQKYVKKFEWENTWGAFYLFTMVIIPALFALLFLKSGVAIWRQVGFNALMIPFAFGLLWGLGMILFGLGIHLAGISVGYAIMMGLSVVVGSLVPLLTQHTEEAFTSAGWVVISGIVVCSVGVGICGRAGLLRERSQAEGGLKAKETAPKMGKGILICIIAGFLGPCVNLAFSFGNGILEASKAYGNSPVIATLSVWILVFWGGFLSSGIYSIYLLGKKSTWKNFTGSSAGFNLVLVAIMALLHFLILFFYGLGTQYLGKFGTTVGWALCLSTGLLLANVMGFLTSEWKKSSRKSQSCLFAGLAFLVVGIVVLAMGNNAR